MRTLREFQKNVMRMWSQSKISFFGFVFVVKRIRRQGESKIPFCNPSDGKLLLRPSASDNKILE